MRGVLHFLEGHLVWQLGLLDVLQCQDTRGLKIASTFIWIEDGH